MNDVSTESLEKAKRELVRLEGVHRDVESSVPPWLVAATEAVNNELQDRDQ